MSAGKHFEKLIEIIGTLRGEGGCPWDKEQTPETVKRYIVEEAYEAVTEVENRNSAGIMEELGDLIFMTLFMAYLYQQNGDFSIEDILKKAASKMIYRHPHVFGDKHSCSTEEVKENWERLKQKEKEEKGTFLDIPRSLPALMRAHRLVGRARELGCPEDDTAGLVDFVKSQLDGIKKEPGDGTEFDKVADRIGQCLLALVCIARHYGINAEDTLQKKINEKLKQQCHNQK